MTATVSLTPDELTALDRHHQGASIPTDQTTLGRILTKVRAGAHWQAHATAPPAHRVGRIPQAMKPATGRCDYCASGNCACNDVAA